MLPVACDADTSATIVHDWLTDQDSAGELRGRSPLHQTLAAHHYDQHNTGDRSGGNSEVALLIICRPSQILRYLSNAALARMAVSGSAGLNLSRRPVPYNSVASGEIASH